MNYFEQIQRAARIKLIPQIGTLFSWTDWPGQPVPTTAVHVVILSLEKLPRKRMQF